MTREQYVAALAAELGGAGVPGRLRERILAEVDDHLRSDAASLERFGDPSELAAAFAEELATDASRGAAFGGFAALAAAGAFFAAIWSLTVPAGGWADIFSGEVPTLAPVVALGLVLAPQVSVAAGVLALLRAVRRRAVDVMPAAEVALLLRRTRVALASGLFTMLSLELYALNAHAEYPRWYWISAAVGAAVLATPLAVVFVRARAAATIRSRAPGSAGDIFDDLPVALPLPRRSWALCAVTAVGVGLLALLAGGVDEGPRNAVFEMVAVVGGYLALGRRLGIRAR